ncbi:hypothetical protein [Pseudomonas amygdali]|uniref:hypothetical protein n=1 Tax=Pseudomonas amygdali TaxID=47877 RepID=UPI0005C7BCA9|nr:hypothetical protein [Pseudomonas amygdali]KIY17105.1 hypothetical protein RD00_19370 [Pseudomonas amygdali pv. tabaci]
MYIGYERKDFKVQKKGSNWKFLVGAAAGAFVAYRSLKNSKPPTELGKPNDVNLAAPQILHNPKQAKEAVTGLTPKASKIPENKSEYYFGHLPVQNFVTALIVAMIFKWLGLGMTLSFLNDNASIDNLFAGGAVISWSLIIYAFSLLFNKTLCCVRLFQSMLTTNIKFFFDVALFASAFLLVKLLAEKDYSCESIMPFAFLLFSIIGMNHVFLMLQGKDSSTVAAAKWLDKANPLFKKINVKFTALIILALIGLFSIILYAVFSFVRAPFNIC